MRIIVIKTNPEAYSCNVYLILGDFNKLDDVNTLIDTGSDGYIISEIKNIYTGAGKKPVEQIVLTHSHFDHTGGIKALIENFNPKILAYNKESYVSRTVLDDDTIRIGDSQFQVIHTPGHSFDSICLYNYEQKVLFSGDTPIDIKTTDSTYSSEFIIAFQRLASLKIDCIYPGHGTPITESPELCIKNSMKNIYLSS